MQFFTAHFALLLHAVALAYLRLLIRNTNKLAGVVAGWVRGGDKLV